MEKKILEAACNDREAFSVIHNLVSPDTLSDSGRAILTAITSFYSADTNAHYVDKDLLGVQLQEAHPKNHGELLSVVSTLGDTSPANVVKEIIKLKRKDLARELATILISSPESPKIHDIYRSYEDIGLLGVEEVESAAVHARDSLTALADKSKAIRLYPNALNDRLSTGARHGNHIVVFARPNVGKTAFLINLVRGFLRDNRRVLYLINEEPSDQVLKRIVSRIISRTAVEIDAGVDEALALTEGVLENLYLFDLSPGTFKDIYSLTKQIEPDVVIIDQIRNIQINEESRVLALEKAAMAARNLGKELGPLVISVTQAGDSARNKLVLDDGDIDFSNTGIPATADLIIGLGCNSEYKERGRRVITIVKNKLGNDHSNFPVSIDEPLSKILSL